jgi:NAD(P)-dependent dehydrogenase (short-subunit alcohol dehydrogenase family)
MNDLKRKVAVVTGAASGIGKAISKSFVEAGATVLMSDVNVEGGQKACEELKKINSDTNFIKTDVSIESQVKNLILTAVKDFGKLDVMVNNAGRPIGGYPVTDMMDEDWQAVLASNLSSVFYGCKHSIPVFKKNGGGSIINIASAQAHTPLPGWAAYAATKGGIISMTRQLATEFGPLNIRTNSISPGTINTEMVKQVVAADGSGDIAREMKNMHPLERIGEPEEIGAAAVFLASAGGGFANGADFRIDGGLTITPRMSPGTGSKEK